MDSASPSGFWPPPWASWPREKVVIATKGGLRPVGNGVVRDASPAWIREGVESSLRALATDQMEDFSATLAVKTLQPPYHLFRRAIEVEVLP